MSNYVEWHGTILHHPKIYDLMRILSVPRHEAIGRIACLSAWAIQYRPGGIMERKYLPEAVAWLGDHETIIAALLESKWVEPEGDPALGMVRIHDWEEVTRGYRRARQDAQRQRDKAARLKGPAVAEEDLDDLLKGVEAAPRADQKPRNQAATICDRLLELWNEAQGGSLKTSPKRIAKVKARLQDGFNEEQLVDAVTKITKSAWHNGANDRGWKAPGPEWVLHTQERVEEWNAKSVDEIVAGGTPQAAPSEASKILAHLKTLKPAGFQRGKSEGPERMS